MFAGLAGVLTTYQAGVVSPSRAGLAQSVLVVMAALLGGFRKLEGGLLGGMLIVFLLSITNEITSRYWLIIGTLFILVVMFLPNGLLGSRFSFSRINAKLRGRRPSPGQV